MRKIEIAIIVLYGIIGIISLVMAYKSLFSKRFISFHEGAAGRSWNDIDKRLQYVILALMRVSGLGFLVIALLLLIFPIINYFAQDKIIRLSVPLVSFIFCLGLFIINYILYRQTKSPTPWKGSIFAMIAIFAGIILSLFA